MKLVDILARRLLAWPEHAVIVVQDGDKDLKFSEDSSAYIDEPAGVWIRGGRLGFLEDGRIDDLADDHLTAIVTRAQWQEAREALVSGEYSNLDNPPVGATHYIKGAFVIDSWWMREPGDNWYLWAEPSRQWALDTPSAGQKNLMKPIREALQAKDLVSDREESIGANTKKQPLDRSNNYLAEVVATKVFYRHGNIFWGENIRRKDLVGKVAGSVSSTDGYRYVKCGKHKQRVAVHRVIFLMHHGYLPDVIDHANRIRDDNRIENLRDAGTESNNQGNQSHQTGTSSRFKGVCWDASRGKWASYIKHDGRRINLGRFESETAAALAYNRKASEIFGSFANLNDVAGPLEQIAAEELVRERDQFSAKIISDSNGVLGPLEAMQLFNKGYRKVKHGNQKA